MPKVYIKEAEDLEQHGDYTRLKVRWTLLLEAAQCWKSRSHAEEVCKELPKHNIKVETAEGQHVCKDFQVEQRAPEEFAIFCTHHPAKHTK